MVHRVLINKQAASMFWLCVQGLLKNEGKERYGDQYRKWQQDPAGFMIDDQAPIRYILTAYDHCYPLGMRTSAICCITLQNSICNSMTSCLHI